MRIGIDISQIVYTGTGVAKYVRRLVTELLNQDQQNEYVLFGSSLRQRDKFYDFYQEIVKLNQKVQLKVWPIPPTLLDIFWNRLHVLPIEWLIGKVDIFWSSDWTQPPLAIASGVTTIHDLSILRYPKSYTAQIQAVHKRRLKQAFKECQLFFCDSQATARDAQSLLKINKDKLKVIYPGFN